jgi:hypothetical protein
MFTLLALFLMAGVGFAVFLVALMLIKFTFNLALLPLKLLFLPFILIFVIVKVVLVVTALTVVAAILIPILILMALCAAPFLLFAAFS